MNVLLLDKTKKLELVKGEVKHADVVTVKGKGYKIIADAVTYLVKERLFGFLPPKIQPTFFGLDSDSALLILDNETLRIDKSFFDIEMKLPNKKKTILKKFEIPLIGKHNIKNATAAVAVSYFIGISPNILKI